MPYIERNQRKQIDKYIDMLILSMNGITNEEGFKTDDARKGVFNYVVTKLALGVIGEELKYGKINDVVGAMECCKMELYRRLAVPYEDKKAFLNGDVYEVDTKEKKCKRTCSCKSK